MAVGVPVVPSVSLAGPVTVSVAWHAGAHLAGCQCGELVSQYMSEEGKGPAHNRPNGYIFAEINGIESIITRPQAYP